MTKVSKKKKIILMAIPVMAIIAFGLFLFLRLKDSPTYIPPKQGPIVEAIYGLGKVKAHKKYEVKIGVASRIVKAYVKEGDFVEKGSPLLKFRDFEVVRAPFAGTVTKFDFQAPEIVSPVDTILTMEDLTDRYIEVSLEQEGALQVRKGQSAKVLFESLRGLVYEGSVDKVFPKEDEFLVQIEIPELGKNILPGMTADVTIAVANHENALLIPVASVSNGMASAKRKGKKIKIPVRLGSVDGQWAQVLEGDIKMSDRFLVGKKE